MIKRETEFQDVFSEVHIKRLKREKIQNLLFKLYSSINSLIIDYIFCSVGFILERLENHKNNKIYKKIKTCI